MICRGKSPWDSNTLSSQFMSSVALLFRFSFKKEFYAWQYSNYQAELLANDFFMACSMGGEMS